MKNTAKKTSTRKPRRRKGPKQPQDWAADEAARLAAGRDPRQTHFDFYLVLEEPSGSQRKADRRWGVVHRFRLPALSVPINRKQRGRTESGPTLADISGLKKKSKRTWPAVGK